MIGHRRATGPGALEARSGRLAPYLLLASVSTVASIHILLAADKTALDIQPGPRVISAEEKGIAPDPAAGSEDGVILVDESTRDDTGGADTRMGRHVRAKILSAGARSLADVELPLGTDRRNLKKWWGVTILPDGRVLELPVAELREQEAASALGRSLMVLKGTLPGVVPGAVIDYGWVLWNPRVVIEQRIELQKPWPVLESRHRWLPGPFLAAAYHMSRAEGLDLKALRSSKAILVEGRHLPAATREPWMPPRYNSFAAATFYYMTEVDTPADGYWRYQAKRTARRLDDACHDAAIREALGNISLSPQAPLADRLRSVYDWIDANIVSTETQSFEQEDAAADDARVRGDWARVVLTERRGKGADPEMLFACMARLLGAESRLVLATDRTERLYDASILSRSQFAAALVSVRAPGDPDDRAVLADPGLGLPYGESAWWLSGGVAFLADPDTPRTVKVRPTNAKVSVSEASTTVTFDGGSETARVNWSRIDRAQHGLRSRLNLRRMAPDDRRAWLDETCGASGHYDIERAAAPGLEKGDGIFRLECEGTMTDTRLTPEIGGYTFHLMGPWIESPPVLPSGKRVHPIVFDYPHSDVNVIEVHFPKEFEPTGEPMVIPVQSEFGAYRLVIHPKEDGYRIERLLRVDALSVPAAKYEALRDFYAEVARADRTALPVGRRAEAP